MAAAIILDSNKSNKSVINMFCDNDYGIMLVVRSQQLKVQSAKAGAQIFFLLMAGTEGSGKIGGGAIRQELDKRHR